MTCKVFDRDNIKNIREEFEKETSLIARHDMPEYMDWLEEKIARLEADNAEMLHSLALIAKIGE